MIVYLVYNGDEWLSTKSLSLVAVCESKAKAEELMLDDIETTYGIYSRESVSEEDYDEDETYMEDIIDEYHATGQVHAQDFGYYIEEVETDQII